MSYRISGLLKCKMTNAINCKCGFARDSNPNLHIISWRILERGDHKSTYIYMTTNAIGWPRVVIRRKDGVDITHKC